MSRRKQNNDQDQELKSNLELTLGSEISEHQPQSPSKLFYNSLGYDNLESFGRNDPHPRSSSSSYFLVKTILYKIFNFLYTVAVSLFFGSFAFRRGEGNLGYSLLYATSSMLVNFPMCWLFLDKAYETIRRLLLNERDYAFKVSGVLSILFASLTTVAGFRVVSESMSVISKDVTSPFVIWPLTFFSLMNVFTTRFVGSVYLFFLTYQKLFSSSCIASSYEPYHQLLLDMKNFNVPDSLLTDQFSESQSGFSMGNDDEMRSPVVLSNWLFSFLGDEGHFKEKEIANLNNYIENFYQAIIENDLERGKGVPYCTRKELLIFLCQLSLCLIVINMMPLWINLTYYGSETINVSKSKVFIILAALSNETFYMNSAIILVPNLIKWMENIKRNSSRKIEKLGIQDNVLLNKCFPYFVSSVLFLTLSTLAYFSGAGYAEDGRELTGMGFNSMIQSLWGWMDGWTHLFIPIYSIVTGFSAGLVNLSAVISFCLQHLSFFKKESSTFGRENVESLIEEVRVNKNKLGQLNKKGIASLILSKRSQTFVNSQEKQPLFLWLGCCSAEDGEEPLKNNSNFPSQPF